MGSDFFGQFCRTICGISTAASYLSNEIGLFHHTKETECGHKSCQAFGIVSYSCSILLALYVDNAAVNFDGDGFEFVPIKQVFCRI
jgi:hypothetical protein